MADIRLGTRGTNYTKNNIVVPHLRMYNAFPAMAYLDRWASNEDGRGGEWGNMVDQWFGFIAEMGMDGVRVFMETTGWREGEHPVFNANLATSDRMWDYNGLWNGTRPRRLTFHTQKMLLRLVQLLKKHGLVAELVVDATLKHDTRRGRAIPWGTIGHCIRQTARFFQAVETGEIDEPGVAPNEQVFDPRMPDNLRDVLNAPANIMLEGHNEWDAHSRPSWVRQWPNVNEDELVKNALNEINVQAARMRRSKDGEPEQWPAAVFGVSHGGRNDFDYRVGGALGYSDIRLHPNRGGDWWTHTNLAAGAQVPRFYNEIKNYVSQAEWDEFVTRKGAYSPNSSTTELDKYLAFTDGALANGISITYHSSTGIHGGFAGLNSPLPITPLEQELLRRAGGDGGDGLPDEPDVPDPPPDEPDPPPTDDPDTSSLELILRDAEIIKLECGPVTVRGGDENFVFRSQLEVPVNSWISKAFIFQGLDRGDIVEMDTFILEGNRKLAGTSLHKEVMGNYEAQTVHLIEEEVESITIYVTLRVNGTGQNPEHTGPDGHYRKLLARGHWGIELQLMDVGAPTPPQDDPSFPLPDPEPDAPVATYYPLWAIMKEDKFGRHPHINASWQHAIHSIDQQLLWDGQRHLSPALARPDLWPHNGISQNRAAVLFARFTDILMSLRHFIHLDDRTRSGGGKHDAIGGTWIVPNATGFKSRTRIAAFQVWYTIFAELYPELERLNGLGARLKG